jgi:hypothetical protein
MKPLNKGRGGISMSKVAQIYGLSVNEALKLSDAHVQLMIEHAETTATDLLASNAGFKQALSQKLAGVKRAVRNEIGTSSGGDDSIQF